MTIHPTLASLYTMAGDAPEPEVTFSASRCQTTVCDRPVAKDSTKTRRQGSRHPLNSTDSTLQAAAITALITHIVSTSFGIPMSELRAKTRRKAPTAFARQVAMYLAHIGPGLSLTAIGIAFARDRTTAAHACALVEDRRDDPRFDTSLSCLEHAVRASVRCYCPPNR